MVFAAGRMVPAQAMLLGSAEPRVRGAFMSLNTAVQHLATGIAPVIAGSLIAKTDDGKITGFPLVGLVAAAAAAGFDGASGPTPHGIAFRCRRRWNRSLK